MYGGQSREERRKMERKNKCTGARRGEERKTTKKETERNGMDGVYKCQPRSNPIGGYRRGRMVLFGV